MTSFSLRHPRLVLALAAMSAIGVACSPVTHAAVLEHDSAVR